MKRSKIFFTTGVLFIVVFIIWTLLISFVDRQAIGPLGTAVGFAGFNGAVHQLFGVNMALYTLTDWLGLVPFGCVFIFACMGLIQWVRRRSIFKVDRSIITLGIYYIAVLCFYLLFENLVINYRPVLIEGHLEASYPSSTTLLTLCVTPTVVMQVKARLSKKSSTFISLNCYAFTAFMVISRLISGVHWVTDIIGGAILSTGMLLIYYSVSGLAKTR